MKAFSLLFSPRNLAVAAAAMDAGHALYSNQQSARQYQEQNSATTSSEQQVELLEMAVDHSHSHLSAEDCRHLSVAEFPVGRASPLAFGTLSFRFPGFQTDLLILVPNRQQQMSYIQQLQSQQSPVLRYQGKPYDIYGSPSLSASELVEGFNHFSLAHEFRHIDRRDCSQRMAASALASGADVAIAAQSIKTAFQWIATAGRFTAGAFALVSVPVINHLAGYLLGGKRDNHSMTGSLAARELLSRLSLHQEKRADEEAVQQIIETKSIEEARSILRSTIQLIRTEFHSDPGFFRTHPKPSERVELLEAGLRDLNSRERMAEEMVTADTPQTPQARL